MEKFVKNKYVAELAKLLDLNLETQKEVLKIEKQFKKKKSELVKSNQWKGDSNKQVRLKVVNEKNRSLKKLIGKESFQLKKEFDKEYERK